MNAPTREILGPLAPDQLLGTAQFLACQLTACLQVGMENTFAAKVQLEKELADAKEQVDVLTAERDSALAAPLLHAKIKSLTESWSMPKGSVFLLPSVWKRWRGRLRCRLPSSSPAVLVWHRKRKRLSPFLNL
ncbi:hypothetical protein PIB30_027668 [Stylosanthes scabra]|uniref:Uncharacterized protein n=1 Tax=Stylosanthes scabra TaxID=79078 RepID=A0ABU6SAC6_9FABA|nr:hypothetical protein [Stylosanthes scabra]